MELLIMSIILVAYVLCLVVGIMSGKKKNSRNPYYGLDEGDHLSMELRRMRTLDYWNNPIVKELRIRRDETKFD